MRVDALFNKLKTALFILALCFDAVAYGQSSQSSPVAKTPQIDLQQGAAAVSEIITTDVDRKITLEDSFSLGKGYLVEVPADHPTIPTPYRGTFAGVPNAGAV